MSEFLGTDTPTIYLLPLLLVVLLLTGWLVYRRRQRANRSLASILATIAYERVEGLVIPNTDDGEIQIDHVLLTAEGLLIVDVKDVDGAVFGSDKMQDWTVISDNHRFTFSNPQPALYDRIAAVKEVVRQVPVTGRVVFLDGARFTKGIPSMTCGLDELLEEFNEPERASALAKVKAFRPHWEQLKRRALAVPQVQQGRRRMRA
ncbi:MAG: NERD domain-containing protein [Gammaproteobacteria bacterium]|nr:NERD domain-containing protein [Gammaproteobacteria bacterium]